MNINYIVPLSSLRISGEFTPDERECIHYYCGLSYDSPASLSMLIETRKNAAADVDELVGPTDLAKWKISTRRIFASRLERQEAVRFIMN